MKPLSEKWLRLRIAFLLCLFSLLFLIRPPAGTGW
jgi:hypothetical protein